MVDDLKEEDEQFAWCSQGRKGVYLRGSRKPLAPFATTTAFWPHPARGDRGGHELPWKTLVGLDEFDGLKHRLDQLDVRLGRHGWGNQELQVYTNQAENAYVANGNLMIVAEDKEPLHLCPHEIHWVAGVPIRSD